LVFIFLSNEKCNEEYIEEKNEENNKESNRHQCLYYLYD